MEILRQVWVQHFHLVEGEVRRRDPKDRPPGAIRLVTPHDAEARGSVKRDTCWDGYKVHLTKTCEPHAPNLVTNVATTCATVADSVMAEVIHAGLAGRDCLPAEHWVDAGYPNAAQVVAARTQHDVDLQGRIGADTTTQRGSRHGQDAFTIDWDRQHVDLPHRRHQHAMASSALPARPAGDPGPVQPRRLPRLPQPARLRQLTQSRTPGAHSAPPGRTRHRPQRQTTTADRRLETPLQDPRRRRGDHLPRRPTLRPAQIPLPRPGQNCPATPTHRRRDEPRPDRRPPHRNTPSRRPHQPLRTTSPRRIDPTGRSSRTRINQQHPTSVPGPPYNWGSPGRRRDVPRARAHCRTVAR